MAQSLVFNWQAMYQDLTELLQQVINELVDEIYREATQGMSANARTDTEKENATFEAMKMQIEGSCIFYANAIIESFGMGTQADSSYRSYWREYSSGNNPLWNPARRGKEIVGRPAGAYTNLWGEELESTGSKVGQPTGRRNGKAPTFSIQNAEVWVIKDSETKIERRIEVELSKFFAERAGSYFIEVGG